MLHAPRHCKYCDMYPEQQRMRVIQGINFTGEHDPTKQQCPAEFRRPISRINKWAGNVEVNPYQDDIEYLAENEKDI